MKSLVVYYSKSGNTKKVGQLIAEQAKADVEELKDLKKRSGIFGWIGAGRDGMKGNRTKIAPTTKDKNKRLHKGWKRNQV